MRWTEKVIAAHKKNLNKPPADRRPMLVTLWEQFQAGGPALPAVEKALELVGKGSANEVELGFYILMDLAFLDPTLQCHISELTKHKSATARSGLAFYLSEDLPAEFGRSVFATLLRDKAASVRVKTIETIGMRDWKTMLAHLRELRCHERNAKVLESLEFWLPLLEVGYRVDPFDQPGCFTITALTGNGTTGKIVEGASGPDDPRILAAIEELKRR